MNDDMARLGFAIDSGPLPRDVAILLNSAQQAAEKERKRLEHMIAAKQAAKATTQLTAQFQGTSGSIAGGAPHLFRSAGQRSG